ncbi:acylphosphatase [Oxynema aestuarii]|jgi:acylphosphatase|uniref:acylphosphatase n=1 Tax=Oxynema aestuarii AP17 TaxID=2064643 RepID=A0A6H1TTN8_9CYAN|nr:acylphosphatase [Oxynema aestuarii]QIZ69952.1 acylphosphatase [Oxynema aestuarii AP17]RMH77498.1 MAG: acylphosphatase [Cyanobacteria bacterium J007]
MSETICTRLLISGRVQGVGYRFSTVREAEKLGVVGWVRNLPSTQVEAVLEGDRPQVEQMISWCERGPGGAIVDRVEVESRPPEGFASFEIRY